MSTEYARLNKDSRPELVGGFFSINDKKEEGVKKVIRINENNA